MSLKQKKIADQVIVITGASSGIGLATAQAAAEKGASVVLASRDAVDIENAAADIRAKGGNALAIVADVGEQSAMQLLAEQAVAAFGCIDTWVNNAGVSMYGLIEEVPVDDARQLFQTNYWGVVYGSLAALPHLRKNGGTLINVGSVLSETAIPLQGHYCASKHAVKGFTDTLRMELHKDDAPVVVTLIQPAAIDTPYPQHAMNYMDVEAKHMDPVYAPEIVADAIITCAQSVHRNLRIGGGAKMFTMFEKSAPGLADKYKELTAFGGSKTDRPSPDDDTLYAPRPGDGRVHGEYEGHVMKRSIYTTAALNPVKTLIGAAAIGLGLAGLLYASRED